MNDIINEILIKNLTDSDIGRFVSSSKRFSSISSENFWRDRILNDNQPLYQQIDNAIRNGVSPVVLILLRDYGVKHISNETMEFFIQSFIGAAIDKFDHLALIASYMLRYLTIDNLSPLLNQKMIIGSGLILYIFDNPGLENYPGYQLPRITKCQIMNSDGVVRFMMNHPSYIVYPFFLSASINTLDRKLIDFLLTIDRLAVGNALYQAGYYEYLSKNILYNTPCLFLDDLSIDDQTSLKLIDLNANPRANVLIDTIKVKRPGLLRPLGLTVPILASMKFQDLELALIYADRASREDALRLIKSTIHPQVVKFLLDKWKIPFTKTYLSGVGYYKYLAQTIPDFEVQVNSRTTIDELETIVRYFKTIRFEGMNINILNTSPYLAGKLSILVPDVIRSRLPDYLARFINHPDNVNQIDWLEAVVPSLESLSESSLILLGYLYVMLMSKRIYLLIPKLEDYLIDRIRYKLDLDKVKYDEKYINKLRK